MIKIFNLLNFLVLIFFVEVVCAQSPYKFKTGKELALLGSGIGMHTLGFLLHQIQQPLTAGQVKELTPKSINRLDRGAISHWSPKTQKTGTMLLGINVLLPLSLLLSGKVRSDLENLATLYSETMFFALGSALVSKPTIGRNRPFVYNTNLPLEKKTTRYARRSFYSGHAVTAFAASAFFAKVYSDYFPNSKYRSVVWSGALLQASVVGYTRYRAGKHFPTDILTGAIVGAFIGFIIPEIHKQEKKSLTEPQPDIAFSFSF